MKTAKTASIAILLVSITTSAFAVQGGPGLDQKKDPFEGLGQDIDRAQLTFDTDQQPMTDAEARALASQLSAMSGVDLKFNQGRSDPTRMVFTNDSDHSTILDVDLRNGAFLFNAGMNGLRGEMDTPRLPGRDRAESVARHQLEVLRRLPKPQQMVLEHIGGLNMSVHREDGTTDDFRKLVTVRFSRKADDIAVLGPGGRIIVQLGEAGKLRGLVFNWERFSPRSIAPSDKLTLLEVRMLALKWVGFVAQDATDKKIDTVDVVYFDDGLGVMEPSVRVVAQLTFESTAGTIKNPYDFYIPLLRSPLGYYPFMEDQGVPPPVRD